MTRLFRKEGKNFWNFLAIFWKQQKRKTFFCSLPYAPGLSEKLKRILQNNGLKVALRGSNTLACFINQTVRGQFVVTNCCKERPGSIVTETLKKETLIPIVTSKESHFITDFKYIRLIKFSLTHKKLRAWENWPYFRKLGETPFKSHRILRKAHHQIQRMREVYSRSFKLLFTKMWNFVFFATRQITGACLFVCLFFVFFPGVVVSTHWS